jgi:PAS domain S-box-containing protein
MKDMGNFRTPFFTDSPSQGQTEDKSEDCGVEKTRGEDLPAELGCRECLISEKTSDLISVVTFSLSPTYRYVSPSHKSVLGYDSKDLVGKCPFDLIHPDDTKLLQPLLAHYVDLKKRQNWPPAERAVSEKLNYRIKDKQGEWRYLETTGDQLDENFILFVSRDVTEKRKIEEELRDIRDKLIVKLQERHEDLVKANERLQAEIAERKRTEESLRQSEERYRIILESIEDGYYEVDLAGSLIFFNDALCKILGYTREEMAGLNNRQYMNEETARAVYKAYNGVYRTGKPNKVFGYELIRKDGNIRIVEVSVSLIRNTKGEPQGFRGIARDMTDRRAERVPSSGRAK